MHMLEITKIDGMHEYVKAGKSFIEAAAFMDDFVKITYPETSFRKVFKKDQFSAIVVNPRNVLGKNTEVLRLRIVKPEMIDMTEIGLW